MPITCWPVNCLRKRRRPNCQLFPNESGEGFWIMQQMMKSTDERAARLLRSSNSIGIRLAGCSFCVVGLKSFSILFLLWWMNLVILEESPPGTTAEQKRLHKRAFGLDGVHQIVTGPCLKQLCQGDGAKFGMLHGPLQVLIRHLSEQGEVRLARIGERGRELRGR